MIGAAVVDISGVGTRAILPADSNPGEVGLSVGGVGKNIAENLTRLGLDVAFLTFFGDDVFAGFVRDHLARAGVTVERAARPIRIERLELRAFGPDWLDGWCETNSVCVRF